MRREVAALDQHVGGDRKLETRVRPQERAVIAHAEQRAARPAIEEAPDELELVQARDTG
jgi:hypothetical protein